MGIPSRTEPSQSVNGARQSSACLHGDAEIFLLTACKLPCMTELPSAITCQPCLVLFDHVAAAADHLLQILLWRLMACDLQSLKPMLGM